MALTDHKITSYQDNVKALSDYPSDDGVTAEQLKAIFDGRTDKEVKNSINGIIDTLTASGGAAEIGTDGGKDIQTALDEKADIEDPEFIRSISIQGNDGKHRIGEGGNSSGRTEIQNTRFGTKRCLIIGEDELRYRIGNDLTEHKIYAENNKPTKADVGLSNVDNTSDMDKPVSTAVQAELSEHESMIDGKVDKISGKGLSTNDYTTSEKNKLLGIEAGANKTIVDSELSASSTNPVQNKVVKTELSKKADINSPYFYEDAIFNGGAMTSFSPKYTVSVNDDKVELSYKSNKSPMPDKIIFGDGSLKFQTSNQEYDVYTSLNPLPVDSALSSTSTNPVQNKVVKAELDGKMDKVPKSVTVEDPDSFVTVKIIPGEIERYGEARFIAKDKTSDSYMAIIMDPHIGMPLSFEQKIALKEMESGVIYTSLNPQTTMCGFSFASMTQEEYEALAEKDENTIYLVV